MCIENMFTSALFISILFELVHSICGYNAVAGVGATMTFKDFFLLNNMVCPENLNPYGRYSVESCAAMCAFVSTCDGYSYSKPNNTCTMCTKSIYTPSWSLEAFVGVSTYLLPCSRQWKFFGGSCYFLHTTPTHFTAAQTNCESQAIGGHLVYIESQAENDFLASMLNAKYPTGLGTSKIWIGGLKDNTNYFRWLDGNPVDNSNFSDWGPGEPTNGGGDNCLAARSTIYKWTDDFCQTVYWSVCEVTSLWV